MTHDLLDRERVLQAVLKDERLTAIPAKASERRVILEHIVGWYWRTGGYVDGVHDGEGR
jgi:hypothetical protein